MTTDTTKPQESLGETEAKPKPRGSVILDNETSRRAKVLQERDHRSFNNLVIHLINESYDALFDPSKKQAA